MATTLDVVGSTPISITGDTGGQRVVPLSALQFNGSAVQLKPVWASAFSSTETTALLAIATARVAGGELLKAPLPLATPALVITAAVPGPESNGITVNLAPDPSGTTPLSTAISVSATETDTYAGLTTAAAAAAAIGTDQAPAAATDPPVGTGLVQVKSDSVGTGTKLPVDVPETALTAAGLSVKDSDGNTLFTLLPRPGYTVTTGLTVTVTQEGSMAFTVTADYDSSKETSSLPTFTIQGLGPMPPPVAYLIGITAPASGAAVPAVTPAGGATLTGGGPGLAARVLLYTPSA